MPGWDGGGRCRRLPHRSAPGSPIPCTTGATRTLPPALSTAQGLCAPSRAAPAPFLGLPAQPCRRHGPGAPTMSFSSPTKDVPLPLGEFLSWVSDVSRSWIGSRGALDAAAPRLSSPAQTRFAADGTGLSGTSAEGLSPEAEELERAQQRGEGTEWRLEVHEQLLALRHWLDAVEKRLPEPGPALQAGI